MKHRKRGGRRRSERGVQLVELMIVLPILFIMMAAIVEFGQYFYTYSTLAKATRSAARYLTSRAYTSTALEEAKRIAVCGNPGSCASQSTFVPGLTSAHIQITSTGSVNLPDRVTVRIVGYLYQPVFEFGSVSLANIEVSPSTTMRFTLSN